VGERRVAGEGGGEDDPGVVAQGVRQPPPLRKPGAEARRLVAHHQGKPGVAHGVEAGTDGETGHRVQRSVASRVDAELLHHIEGCVPSGQLHDVGRVVDGLERRVAGGALDEPGHAHVHLLLPELLRDDVDELLTLQDPLEVRVVEDLRHSGETERGAGDDDRFGHVRGRRHGGLVAGDLQALFEDSREQVSELDIGVGGQVVRGHGASRLWGRDRWCADGGRAGRHFLRAGGRQERRRAGAQTGGPQPAERRVDGRHVAVLGVVGEQREHVVVLVQDVLDEAVQSLLRTHLHEDARPRAVQRAQTADELHRGGDLTSEQVDHRLAVGRRWVEVPGHVGDDRQLRAAQVQTAQRLLQRCAGRSHDRGVEGVADRDPDRVDALRHERLDGALHRCGGPADHRLARAVDVGDDDAGVDRGHDALDLLQRAEDRRECPVVGDRDRRHLLAAGADGHQGGLERHRARRHQRAVLPEAVAHDHVGTQVVAAEKPGEGEIGREDRRLGDLGAGQLLLQGAHGVGVALVDEDVRRQRPAEHRRHDPVRLRERVRDHRHLGAQRLQHVDVLRALPGVEEGDLRGRPPTEEHALRAEHLPQRRGPVAQRRECLAGLRGQVGGVRVVQGDPDGGPGDGGGGRRTGWGHPGGGLRSEPLELRQEVGVAAASEHHGAAQGSDGPVGGPLHVRGRRRTGSRYLGRGERPGCGLVAVQAGDVLLENRVEVRPAEAERADTGPARPIGIGRPLPQLAGDGEGEVRPVDVGVGVAYAEAGRQHPLVQLHHHLEHPGRARRGLEVADVGLDRPERDRSGLGTGASEGLGEALELDRVPYPGGGPVRLDRGGGSRLEPGTRPGAFHSQTLSDGVGRRDAPALAVARATHPEQDGVHAIAVTFGVGEALEHEERRTLAHDEAVGRGVERPGAGGRERADLAELHERVDPHVAVDPAGDHGVVLAVDQPVRRCRRRRQCGGTGCVGGEVRTPEVEQVRDPAGQDVGQLPGHGVLGDRQLVSEEPLVPLLEDRGASRRGQRREGRRLPEVARELRELDPQRGPVVLLATDGVPEHYRDPLGVHPPVRPAGVQQRRPRRRHGPLLPDIELGGDRGWDRKPPLLRLPRVAAHPSADAAVGLVGRRRVRVVVQLGIPPLGGHVADRVPTVPEVLPEGRRVGCVGHDRRDADDSDGGVGVLVHEGS
jgi:hypothetical protein